MYVDILFIISQVNGLTEDEIIDIINLLFKNKNEIDYNRVKSIVREGLRTLLRDSLVQEIRRNQ